MKKMIFCMFIVVLATLFIFITQPTFVYGEPRIDNQGRTNMCAVYATANGIEEQMKRNGIETPENGFSKEWLWKMCKEIENESDASGVQLETALEIAKQYGLCPKDNYSQDEEKNLEYASQYKIKDYTALEIDGIEESVSNGAIVIISSDLQKKNWRDGIITFDTEQLKGGHASYLIGYDKDKVMHDEKGFYEGVNSWGRNWGFSGHYFMQDKYAMYFSRAWYTVTL